MIETPPPRKPRWHWQTRLNVLLVVAAILIPVAQLWKHYRYARPIGEGPAGVAVAVDPYSSVWSDRRVILLGLGDSVTQSYGASPGNGYFERLVKNPTDEFPDMQGVCLSHVLPNLEPRNLSISGTTSIECVEHQLPKLQVHDADTFGVIVMTTGGNDVIHHYGRTPPREGAMYGARASEIGDWVANFDSRLDTIARRVREAFPGGCHLFVANIYDPTDGDGDIQYAGLPAWPEGLQVLAAYNEVLARFADRHPDVTLIDMHSAFLGHGIHCTQSWHSCYCKADPHYWYWDNLEDPNDRGYDAIRRLFLMEMARVLPPAL